LALGADFDRSRHHNDDGLIGVAIEIPAGKAAARQLYIYKERIQLASLDDLLTQVEQIVRSDQPLRRASEGLQAVIPKLDKLLVTLASRIKDPNPFLETLIESVPDMFRR
jgi:hypothetical protein